MKTSSSFDPIYLQFAVPEADSHSRVVGVTGFSSGEGTTSVVSGLARAARASTSKPVLVIDASVTTGRRVASLLRSKSEPLESLASCFDGGDRNLYSWISTSSRYDVDLLTLDPAIAAVPSDSPLWQQALAQLRSKYSLIVIDTAHVHSAVPMCWQHHVDDLVLVVDTTRTTVERLQRFRKDLDETKLQLSGFILNKRRFYVPSFIYRFVY